MTEVRAMIEAMAAMTPHRAFEEVPLTLAPYSFLKLEGGALVTRGTGQRRDGYRWSMSATWDRQTPHYMLPADVVLAQPPKAQLHLTAAQPFDFVYSTFDLAERLSGDSYFRRSQRDGIRVAPVFAADYADMMAEILGAQGFDLPYDVLRRYHWMCSFGLEGLPYRQLEVFAVFAANLEVIGSAMLWFDEETRTAFHCHRYLQREHRRHTRFVDACLAREAIAHGCTELNIGDAHRAPGLAVYKFELRPKRFVHYVNVLDRQEDFDHEQRA
jgi:hypothetical protein